jgi:hypothetical protein
MGVRKSVIMIGPALPGAKLPFSMISKMWMIPAPIRKQDAARATASRASEPRKAA